MQKNSESVEKRFVDTDGGEILKTCFPKTFNEWRESRLNDPRRFEYIARRIKDDGV
jgi:hypothetical protein